jgi:hypothetical protein
MTADGKLAKSAIRSLIAKGKAGLLYPHFVLAPPPKSAGAPAAATRETPIPHYLFLFPKLLGALVLKRV